MPSLRGRTQYCDMILLKTFAVGHVLFTLPWHLAWFIVTVTQKENSTKAFSQGCGILPFGVLSLHLNLICVLLTHNSIYSKHCVRACVQNLLPEKAKMKHTKACYMISLHVGWLVGFCPLGADLCFFGFTLPLYSSSISQVSV